ncbi:MAG: DUF1800 domain-containing protein [Rhodopirellula sp.]|nr:DUF1800 domain-containing protein [Rhodopirellula sp.]
MSTHAETTSPARRSDPGWAWAPYQPDAERPWNLARAGHLLRRAGFGGDWRQLQQALADGPSRSVDRLLRPEADVAEFIRTYDEYEMSLSRSESIDALQAWWLRRMIQSPHPLLEKMTVHWHGHFATGNVKVKSSELMRKHMQRLRQAALGNYAELVAGISHDPAVLLWLGADENRKSRPSEPYARQFLQWCGLGDEEMSQRDIREVARAFTGWVVLRNEIRFIEREHDAGVKQFLGRQGPFRGDDVVRIALAHQAAPRAVVRKVYRWFVSETDEPGDPLLAPLVEAFAKDYDIGRLVETMLRSNLFFSPAAYRRRVKSPIEFALGIIRPLEKLVPTVPLGGDLAELGQDLGNPPTANGWEGGPYWINQATLLGRDRLAAALLSGSGPYADALDPATVARNHGKTDPAQARQFLLELFLQNDIAGHVRDRLIKLGDTAGGDPAQSLRRFAHAIVVQPEFQLA